MLLYKKNKGQNLIAAAVPAAGCNDRGARVCGACRREKPEGQRRHLQLRDLEMVKGVRGFGL